MLVRCQQGTRISKDGKWLCRSNEVILTKTDIASDKSSGWEHTFTSVIGDLQGRAICGECCCVASVAQF